MNSRKQRVLMAGVVLAAAASTFGARAADQSAFFEQQREITDGYYPQYVVTDPSAAAEPTEVAPTSADVEDTIAFTPSSDTESSSAGSIDGLTASEADGGGQ